MNHPTPPAAASDVCQHGGSWKCNLRAGHAGPHRAGPSALSAQPAGVAGEGQEAAIGAAFLNVLRHPSHAWHKTGAWPFIEMVADQSGAALFDNAPPIAQQGGGEVTDAMVEAASDAYRAAAVSEGFDDADPDQIVTHRRWIRAALTAALASKADGGARSVVITEEVPGCEPHWFVRVPGNKGNSPQFDTYQAAVKFCEFVGWTYTTEYFTP